jgi:type IV pilus assembly protein PilY1
MSNSPATLCNLVISALFGMMMAVPAAYADDTEIYTGLNNLQNTIDPNVMFIIDTSGSMSRQETLVSAQYDPATDYPTVGSCESDRVYWSTNGSAPSCNTNQYFERSQFRCDAAQTPLYSTTSAGTGFYQDRLARYLAPRRRRSGRWISLSTRTRSPPHVECKADEGEHGETAQSNAKFITTAANQSYTTNANQRRNWASTGRFYTLFSANYLNYFNNEDNTQSATRIDIVKSVVKELIDANQNLNVSLMRFDPSSSADPNAHGGPIIFPFTDIDEANVKTDFKNTVESLNASGNTPLSETLSEALRIFRGDNAVFPGASQEIQSVASAFESGTKYDSPLDVQCQKNFIVFLSDGEPTADSEANQFTNQLISNVTFPSRDNTCGSSGDNCLDEIAEFMNTQDLIPELDGKQNVVTYTIGFGSDAAGSSALNALLEETGSKGGGNAFVAQDFRQLSNVFTQIITEIQAVNSTFTAPAVSVNAFNRVTNREELFFTLFRPSDAPVWTGNLKRYRLGLARNDQDEIIADEDGNGEDDEPEIRDENGKKAVDPKTGFFDSLSTSFWSSPDSPDGEETAKGGAARLFGGNDNPLSQRNIYSNISDTITDLTDVANEVSLDNTALTSDLTKLGLPADDPDGNEVILWLSGQDVNDEDGDGVDVDARAIMGDPLHSKPLLVEYGQAGSDVSDIVIFMSTNEGVLHALDSDSGVELFSFIPKQHLAKAATNIANSGTGFKGYGLDGPISLYFKDVDGNGFLDTDDGDKYILIFGERRGGTHYYALDITTKTGAGELQPRFLWEIEGGTGDFYELGQTWSAPQQARIRIDGIERDVMVFGGGYDDSTGDQQGDARAANSKGRAIYMIDPIDGSLVWWAGKSTLTGLNPGDPIPNLKNVCFSNGSTRTCTTGDMNFSVAADVRLVQIDGDGLLDRIYAADIGGQLLRIDINNNAANVSGLADGYIVADLQRTNANAVPTLQDNRRFFFAPDPALINPSEGEPFISLAIGSGFRAHPLSTDVEDKMFMVKDDDPFAKPSLYSATRTLIDLKDVTNDLDPTDLANFNGWFINLVNSSGVFEGQKVLSSATTFGGVVFFTTFSPVAGPSEGSCAPNQGAGSVFAVNVEDASPDDPFDSVDGDSASSDPRVISTLVRAGIPPEVTILFPPETLTGNARAFVAAEAVGSGIPTDAVKTYWFEQETQ